MSSPDPKSYLASSKSRTFAYLSDVCACGLLLIPTAYATYLLETPSAGVFEFSLILLAYQAYFLAFRGGVTPGKYVQNIAVVSTNGNAIHELQALLRAASLAMPWLLFSLADSRWFNAQFPRDTTSLISAIGLAWITLDVILIEFSRHRRSLTDWISSTLVVALPPLQPHRAPAVPMFSANDAEFGNPPKRPPSR